MDLVTLAVVLAAAVVAGRAAEAVRVPAVVGEIVVGLLLGPTTLDVVHPSEILTWLAGLGVLVLLFEVGLDLETTELRAVGTPAVRVAVIGVVAPLVAGWAAAAALGVDTATALFLGAALVATSIGVTARTFTDLGVLDGTEARIVLGAAVVDDVLGLVVLSVVLRMATGDGVDVAGTAGSILVATAFLVGSVAIGVRVVPRLLAWTGRRAGPGPVPLVSALVVMLVLAEGAERAGLAGLIGALVAGVLVARSDQAEPVSRGVAPLAAVLVPVFFVSVGVRTDLGALGSWSVVGLAAVLLGVAVLGKLAAGLGAGSPGATQTSDGPNAASRKTDRLLVGVGMVPRGEVGLAFAATGLAAGVLDRDRYTAVILVVLATTILGPLLLRHRLRSAPPTVPARD